MFEQRIAIIGAGVSGLSTAYELGLQAIEHKSKTKIVIYEKSTLGGGNAQTVAFSLGLKKNLPFFDVKDDLVRWADLGVNDINLTAYTTLAKVMEDIGYNNDQLPEDKQRLQALENTECYFTLDGKTTFTDDADMVQGVVDPAYSLQHIEEGNLTIFTQLLYDAAFKAIKKDGSEEDNLDITCADFFDVCVDNVKGSLEEFAKKEKYEEWYNEKNWNNKRWLEKASQWVATLRDNVFYPRISAMYFANDSGPEQMLLAAPFKYYRIQESVGGAIPDRRYFVGGAQHWLEYLADFMTRKLDSPYDWEESKEWVDISIVHNYQAQATILKAGVEITEVNKSEKISAHFNDVIITTHANDALNILKFANDDKKQEAEVTEILGSISYTTSIAVCHTWSGVLPPNRNSWRSYNVLIRQGAALKPYSMTYVCNRHQNDAKNKQYNIFGMPQFFVTLNPQLPIPDNTILRKLPYSDIPTQLHQVLPQATLKEADRLEKLQLRHAEEIGSDSTETAESAGLETGDRAITYFYHNLIDRSCFLAQQRLKQYQEPKKIPRPRLLFGGAWSNGSGLHEECWLQSRRIAERIFEGRQCGE